MRYAKRTVSKSTYISVAASRRCKTFQVHLPTEYQLHNPNQLHRSISDCCLDDGHAGHSAQVLAIPVNGHAQTVLK
jgi:hypothetical protein